MSFFRQSMFAGLLAMSFAAPAAIAQPNVDAIVAKVEPGIACLIVSRSDSYRTFAGGKVGEPGQLGGFDARIVPDRFMGILLSDSERVREFKTLTFRQRYDLGHPDYVPESFGSGIVVDRQGLILTNYHVVQDATKVFVRMPGGKGSYANVIAADPRCDLAVLKVLDPALLPMTPVPFGNADNVRRGQQVIALANPYAAGRNDGQPSVSVGVVSNLHRRPPGRNVKLETARLDVVPFDQLGILIQTDARIALGCSGGALLNQHGECIGITTSLAALAGTDAPGGFALPVNSGIRKIVETLKRGEEVDYGLLGVSPAADDTNGRGARVLDAQLGSPASVDAHLRSGDVIVAVGDVPIKDRDDLLLNLGLYFAGDKVSLGVVRAGTPFKKDVEPRVERVEATLVKYRIPNRTKIIATSLGARPFVGGLRVDYSSLLTHQRGLVYESIPPGVLVTDVQDGSKAERLKIFRDDLVTEVGGVAVNTPAAFYEQIARHARPVELKIRRGDEILRISW